MPNHFGRSFNNIDSEALLTDLKTLENQGCVYQWLYNENIDGSNFYRIEFTPAEIFRFVEAMYAYEEYKGFRKQNLPSNDALDEISSNKIRNRVREYNQWAENEGVSDQKFCPAAFYGRELESIMTGGKPNRYELIPRSRIKMAQE